jgi:succinate-semialdehyde dehydrogenase/glutarate-semialdehyde dehydrogenase
MRNFLADKKLNLTQEKHLVVPIGVLFELCLGTFLLSSSSFAAPNIMVGNTILLKHASIATMCYRNRIYLKKLAHLKDYIQI